MRRRDFLATAMGAGVVAAGSRSASAQADTRPVLTVAVPIVSNSGTLEPLREQNNTGIRLLYSLLEPLIDLDRQGDLRSKPALAESWNRVDERTLDLTMRRGVLFHNGDELTAEDVAFSFGPERMFGTASPGANGPIAPAEVGATGRRIWSVIESVEATGTHAVRIRTKAPDITLEGRLTRLGAEIISKRAYREVRDWNAWARAPVGTGPYKVKDFQRDTALTLAAHDGYWGGRPPAREIRFVVVPEVASRINGLVSGLYDMATDIPPDQLAVIQNAGRFDVVGGPVLQHLTLAFDATNPVLRDARVRRAMTHAIDRQLIVDSLWGGKTVVPRGLQYDFYGPMLIEDWAAPAYDPELAKRLVRESGYRGQPIAFRSNASYYPNQLPTAQVLVEMWKDVGLNVQIEMRESPLQMTTPPEGRGVREWSNTGAFGDPVGSLVFQMGPDGVLQANKEWTNEEFNRLCRELESGTDPVQRKRIHRRLLEIIEREDPAYTMLHQLAVFHGKRRGVVWTASQALTMDFRASNLRFA